MKSKKVKKISQPQVEIFIRNYDITESTFQKRYKSIPGITKNKNGMFVIPEGTRYPYNMRRLKPNTDSKRMYALLDAINRVNYIDENMLHCEKSHFESLLEELLKYELVKRNNTGNKYGCNCYDITLIGIEHLQQAKLNNYEVVIVTGARALGAFASEFAKIA